jgi:uncharacterized protein
MLEDQLSGVRLKKLPVGDTIFYLNPSTLSLLQADSVAVAILDSGIEGNEDILADPAMTYGEERVKEVLNELQVPGSSNLSIHSSEGTIEWKPAELALQDLTLTLTEGCNLQCRYCWQGSVKSNRSMSETTARQVVDFLLRQSSPNKGLKLRFYGGEPLLKFDLIKAIVRYAEDASKESGREISLYITTNGTLMNKEVISFFAEHRVSVDVSIDGLPEIHDRNRRFPNGSGSYEITEARLRDLLAYLPATHVAISMVVTRGSISCLEESISHLRAMGLYRIRVNPVDRISDPDLAFTERELVHLARYYEDRLLEFSGLTDNPYEYTLSRYWRNVKSKLKRKVRCVAGCDGLCVSPDGYLYPCSGFAFSRAYNLGHVSTGLDPSKMSHWLQARGTVDESPVCRECWARYYCGGGCYYRALEDHGDLRIPSRSDCMERQIMIESALRCKLELWIKQSRNSP